MSSSAQAQRQSNASSRAITATSTSSSMEQVSYRPVAELQSHGINVSDIKKLEEAGFYTVGSVLQAPMRTLVLIKGLSEAKVEKIRIAGKKLDVRGSVFKTGLEAKQKRQSVVSITTGSDGLDKILGGGIETSSLTEFFGEFRTGKTQICHTLCVTTQLSFGNHGGQGKVIYIDTEGNFRPERIESIADRFGLDRSQCLDNIIVCRVYSHEEQMDVLKPLAALLSDPDQGPFRLVIVDSVIALFRVEFSGRGELSERQQKLGQYLSQLVKISEEFNVAVALVNQCMADPGALSMFGPVIKPVGGHVLAHASTTRVMLKKGKGDERIAKIFDSPLMPEEDATFRITNGGIDNPA
jgi:meiotic recombination protein DMC1